MHVEHRAIKSRGKKCPFKRLTPVFAIFSKVAKFFEKKR